MLDELSPIAFEEWCKLVLERHYGCPVETTVAVGDEGRDLLVRHPTGLIVAECKHYLRSKVGRPVVQKLHSAVITAGSSHGLIITSGRFSPEAYTYAERLNETIELIDGTRLAVMAQAVGVPMTRSGQGGFGIPTTPAQDLEALVVETILSPERFRPAKGQTPRVQVARTTRYSGFFVATYRASGRTRTAVGDQSANWSGSCWLQADGRQWANGPIPGLRDDLPDPLDMGLVVRSTPGQVDVPALDMTGAMTAMRERLAKQLVEHVSYTGRNNVAYSKEIKPGKRAIQIDDTLLLYVPQQRIRINGLAEVFEGPVVETRDDLIVQCAALANCSSCGGTVTPRTQRICGVCHRTTHRGSWIRPESFQCGSCSALVCPRHVRMKDNQRYCSTCAPFEAKKPLHRLIIPLAIAAFASVAAAVHGEVTNGIHATWDWLAGVSGWVPAAVRGWPLGLGRKGEPLQYPKAPLASRGASQLAVDGGPPSAAEAAPATPHVHPRQTYDPAALALPGTA